jgi:hypothetical protein
MMKAIARRIRRLEDLEVQQQAEEGPDLVAIILERRRKRAMAEGSEPEPARSRERATSRLLVPSGRRCSLADVMLQARKRRLLKESIERQS